jgi:NAD-dependent deacetylase
VVSSKLIQETASLLKDSPRVTVMTGAGVSAASGVPTFRGPDGLWKNFRPERLATPEAFEDDPGLVWEWYQWRRQKIAACEPNRAHHVFADWSRRFRKFHLVTQNVDGLHERAGTENVIRFHGSIWEVRCHTPCPNSPRSWWDTTRDFEALPPPCPFCTGTIRPGVVWFGEAIPSEAILQSAAATDCEVFIVAGTSSVVHPAAGLVASARAMGARTIEINLERTPVSGEVDISILGRVEEILDEVNGLI